MFVLDSLFSKGFVTAKEPFLSDYFTYFNRPFSHFIKIKG
jgi:hypothetical protein